MLNTLAPARNALSKLRKQKKLWNGKTAARSSLRQKQVHKFSLHRLHLLQQRIQAQRQPLWIRVVRSKLDQIRSAMILIAKKKVQENNKRIEAVKIK